MGITCRRIAGIRLPRTLHSLLWNACRTSNPLFLPPRRLFRTELLCYSLRTVSCRLLYITTFTRSTIVTEDARSFIDCTFETARSLTRSTLRSTIPAVAGLFAYRARPPLVVQIVSIQTKRTADFHHRLWPGVICIATIPINIVGRGGIVVARVVLLERPHQQLVANPLFDPLQQRSQTMAYAVQFGKGRSGVDARLRPSLYVDCCWSPIGVAEVGRAPPPAAGQRRAAPLDFPPLVSPDPLPHFLQSGMRSR